MYLPIFGLNVWSWLSLLTFKVSSLPGVNELNVWDSILIGSLPQVQQALLLQTVCGHHQLSHLKFRTFPLYYNEKCNPGIQMSLTALFRQYLCARIAHVFYYIWASRCSLNVSNNWIFLPRDVRRDAGRISSLFLPQLYQHSERLQHKFNTCCTVKDEYKYT